MHGNYSGVELSNFRGKYVVLLFYPMDFTFVCPTEIIEFHERLKEFNNFNTTVLGISSDSKFVHRQWTMTPKTKGGVGDIDFMLCDDKSLVISKAYNVLIEDGPDSGVPYRGVVIINKEGIIKYLSVSDLPVSRDVDEILRIIEGFQHYDEHGTVCPIKFKNNKAAMEEDSEKAMEYFEKTYKD